MDDTMRRAAHAERQRRYYARHREEIAAVRAAYYAEHATEIRERDVARRALNRDVIRARVNAKRAAASKERIAELREQHRDDYARHREKRIATARAGYVANRDERLDQQREYRTANAEEIKARRRARYLRDREQILAKMKADPSRAAYQRAYRSSPERRVIRYCNDSNARAERYGLPGRLVPDEVMALVGPCRYCGGDAGGWDHVEPLSDGGANDISNLVPACFTCNRRKGRRRKSGSPM